MANTRQQGCIKSNTAAARQGREYLVCRHVTTAQILGTGMQRQPTQQSQRKLLNRANQACADRMAFAPLVFPSAGPDEDMLAVKMKRLRSASALVGDGKRRGTKPCSPAFPRYGVPLPEVCSGLESLQMSS